MDMDAALWSWLPLELVEKVLSFVLVPDLCRYRSVCTKWNQLICNPSFSTLHAKNSKRQGDSFIAMEMRGLKSLTWYLLDLNARRWYTFYNNNNIIASQSNASPNFEVAAMDKGLICQISKKSRMLLIFVHDLLGHIVKSLPHTTLHLTSQILPLVHMIVDSTSHHFTIFLLNRGFNLRNYFVTVDLTLEEQLTIMNDPLMRIYDSATGEWRSASNPQDHGLFSNVISMVMCQGRLYALMEGLDHWIAYHYNLEEDSWKLANFCLSKHDVENPQLISITTRLFVASWRCTSKAFGKGYEYNLEVSEIIIPQMTLETLFKLPVPDLMELLEVEPWIFNLIYRQGWCDPWHLEVIVHSVDNGLFLKSWLSGKAKVFDLDTLSWDHGIPKHPLGQLCSRHGPNKPTKQMNLLYPNSLRYLI